MMGIFHLGHHSGRDVMGGQIFGGSGGEGFNHVGTIYLLIKSSVLTVYIYKVCLWVKKWFENSSLETLKIQLFIF